MSKKELDTAFHKVNIHLYFIKGILEGFESWTKEEINRLSIVLECCQKAFNQLMKFSTCPIVVCQQCNPEKKYNCRFYLSYHNKEKDLYNLLSSTNQQLWRFVKELDRIFIGIQEIEESLKFIRQTKKKKKVPTEEGSQHG